ncbi:hypothetical protein [Bartonella choladocola]|uniref:hypothetical protein n=1 Tax=Bartonella choladocola TaxID=2750995 RepID=UPI003B51B4CC
MAILANEYSTRGNRKTGCHKPKSVVSIIGKEIKHCRIADVTNPEEGKKRWPLSRRPAQRPLPVSKELRSSLEHRLKFS